MAKIEYESSLMQYISFGDITEIMKKKKTAECFTNRVKQLVNTPKTTCIIECIYEGVASEIPDNYKAPFILNEFKIPNKDTRTEYFDKFKQNNQNITVEMETEQIVDMTENFTFRDMSKLVEIIILTAKGTLLGDWLKGVVEYEEYINNAEIEEDDKVTIGYDEIEEYIENIKSLKYKQLVKSMPVSNNVFSFVEPNVVNTNRINLEEKPKVEKSEEEKTKEEIKESGNLEKRDAPDTLEELYKMKKNLYTPLKVLTEKPE